MVGVTLALALILAIAAVYGGWSGMWRAAGNGFHGSLGPIALAFATAAAFLGVLDAAGLFTRTVFPPVPSINVAPLLVAAVLYAVVHVVFTRAPFAHHRYLAAALFDRIFDGIPFFRAYSQRRAGEALVGMLDERRTVVYR